MITLDIPMRPFRSCLCLLACALVLTLSACENKSKGEEAAKQIADSLAQLATPVDLKVHNYVHHPPKPLTDPPGPNEIRVITDPEELQAIRRQYAGNHAVSRSYRLERGYQRALEETKWSLRSGQIHFVTKALEDLGTRWRSPKVAIDLETKELVIKLLDRADTRAEAIDALHLAAPNEARDILKQWLKSETLTRRQTRRVLFALEDLCADRECIDMIIPRVGPTEGLFDIQEENPVFEERDQAIYALLHIYPRASDSLRLLIESVLIPLSDGKQLEKWNHEPALVECLSKHPSPRLLPFFEQRIEGIFASDEALIGYAKLQGEAARPMVRKRFKTRYRHAYEAIPYAWKDDLPAAMTALQEAFAVYDPVNRQLSKFVYVAWQMGGTDYAWRFLQSVPNSKEKQEMLHDFPLFYLPIQPDHPFRLKADSLFQLGFVDQPLHDSILEDLLEVERPSTWLFFHLMRFPEFRTVSYLSDESSETPIPYDDLILNQYVPMAHGKLDGVECYLAWDQNITHRVHEQVWVIYRDKGYSFRPINYNGRYDHTNVRKCLNLLLKDAGLPQRYIKFDQAEHTSAHIFIQPENALPVLRILHHEPDSLDGKVRLEWE